VWDPDGPSGSALSPGVWDALRESVLDAQLRWDRVVEHASSADEVVVHLAGLCNAIRAVAVGQEPDLGLVSKTTLSRRLVAVIRGTLLERLQAVAPPPPSHEVLRLLGAVELVGQRVEVDWSQRFADRRSPPFCSWLRPSSGGEAGRSPRFRNGSSASSTVRPSGSAPWRAT
jgi:hypothetical protein